MKKLIKISDVLNVDESELKKFNVLNINLERDCRYYINLKLLEKTENPFFSESYGKIIKRFEQIYSFLEKSKNENDVYFKAAMGAFFFPEMNELCIGLAEGKYGKGLTSTKLRKETLKRAKELIQEGKADSNIFLFIGILQEGIGFDYISDMIGNIIKDDIEKFTMHVNKELKIETQDGFVINPIKKKRIYYLPMDILSAIPTLDWMADIDITINKNSDLRMFVNKVIGGKWKEMSSKSKKDLLLAALKENEKLYPDLIDKYEKAIVEEYDFEIDPVGDVIIDRVNELLNDIPRIKDTSDEKKIVTELCNWFKQMVENNRGNRLLYVENKIRPESYAQDLFNIVARTFLRLNDIDVSPETDSGRGPVDFKLSRGKQIRCLIELKKLSSPQLIHGVEVQLLEYGKAEMTTNLTYLILDDMYDSKNKDNKMKELISAINKSKIEVNLVVVDCKPKKSASIYEGNGEIELDN